MLKSFFLEKKWRLWAWGGLALLIASLWLQVKMTVAINSWYGKFYDLLQNAGDYVDKPQEGINLFFSQLVSLRFILDGFKGEVSFVVIAFPYIFLAYSYRQVNLYKALYLDWVIFLLKKY